MPRTSDRTKAAAPDERPLVTGGMRHVALNVDCLEACRTFYVDLVGMAIEWQPDDDNLFLCSGTDNLALHRRLGEPSATDPVTNAPSQQDRLDHIGFIIDHKSDVDRWHAKMVAAGVEIAQKPKTHRDGARSFYCYDPDRTLVQFIYHPPISTGDKGS